MAGFSERMAARLEKRVADLRQRYDAHQQEKLNHRLAVLTVVSAIFLPLTLVAGIWGMNFERMPELAHPWGYPAALVLMVGIAGGMLWLFRRRGWFG
jgi:magnesium transporter